MLLHNICIYLNIKINLMNKIFIVAAGIFLLGLNTSCSTQTYLDKDTVSQVISNQEFTFMAQKANPLDTSVNNVMNSMPGMTNRILNLDYGYTVKVEKDKLTVNLPYFGRSYTPSYNSTNIGFNFESKDFSIYKAEGKKKSQLLTFNIKDQNTFKKFYLEIFENGRAYLSIDSNDRQPISYDGFIMKNEVKN